MSITQVTLYRNLEVPGSSPLSLSVSDCFNNDEGVVMQVTFYRNLDVLGASPLSLSITDSPSNPLINYCVSLSNS